jgi:signal transduction histidine kinase/DNA-binding response OmpR family regulator
MLKTKKNISKAYRSRTKLFITIGYAILLLLVFYGVMRIYSELRSFSEHDVSFDERQELMMIGNALAALYESESVSRMAVPPDDADRRQAMYDSLQHRAVSKIDSLKVATSDPSMHQSLDSVLTLLEKKHINTYAIFQLIDSIDQVPYREKSITTLLSRKNINDLNRISKMRTKREKDSVVVQVQKKTLRQRLSDVFRSKVEDSVFVKSNLAGEVIDSIIPGLNLKDPVVRFVTNIVRDYDQKRELLTAQLVYQQNELYQTNSRLTAQINNILRDLELREHIKYYAFLQSKEQALSRSSGTVQHVALAALITVVFFLIVSLWSVSREFKYRQQLERARKYAEDLLKNRERLMLTISHDIKAPLSSVIGYIKLLSKSKLTGNNRSYLQNMRNASEQILELVTKLLEYHSLKSSNQNMLLVSFSPYNLFQEIHLGFIPLAEQKGLEFEFVNQLPAGGVYQSDPFRIRQVVNNLLSNAIKFTASGKITLTVSVISEDDKPRLNVVVKDTGIGIDAADREKIFEEYHRLEDARSMKTEGSGLGLAISRKLIALLQGDIRVVSERGEGSEFTFTVPLMESAAPKRPGNQTTASLKILFVDDDRTLLQMYNDVLKEEGYLPVVTTRSPEALTLLREIPFDIIFTDIRMPDMNGFELMKRIRTADFPGAKDVPVIALSASSDISEERLKDAGFSGFISKPFSAELLLSVIAAHAGICSTKKKRTVPKKQGWEALTAFADSDREAAANILTTGINENRLKIEALEKAIEAADDAEIRAIAHRLLPLMRMIDANEIVAILCDVENGAAKQSEICRLPEMLKEKNREAEVFLSEQYST